MTHDNQNPDQPQSPCDHPDPCSCFAEGYYLGKEAGHSEVRSWLPDDHDIDCPCEPCRTVVAVLQSVEPGIISYRDVATLYEERGGRQSDRSEFGIFNLDDRNPPERTGGLLRVWYVHDTGDWCAVRSVEGGRALLIGTITPLVPLEHVRMFFEDWDDHGVQSRPLSWYQRRIALFNFSHVPPVLAGIRKR